MRNKKEVKCPVSSKRIKELLNENNISARELSEKCGVSESSMSHYVNGSHAPSNISAGKIAAVFGVNPLWVMGFDDVSKELYPFSESAQTRLSKYAEEIEELAYDKQELCFQLIENVIKTMKGGD